MSPVPTAPVRRCPYPNDIDHADVVAMPSGIPGTQPSASANPTAPANVQIQLYGSYTLNSYAGVGFQENEVATMQVQVNGQPDTTLSDFHAQINWGDSASWNSGDLVYQGTNGGWADYIIKGSHVYQKPGTDIPIVLYVTGPDDTSATFYQNDIDYANVTPNPNAISLGSLSPTQWQENQPGYDGTISVKGGTGGYQNLQVSGLPSGLSATVLSSTVNGQQSGTITISGTPTQSGTFTLTTTLQDGNGDTGSGTESLTITAAPLTLGNLSPTQWDLNEPGYDGTIAVSGGTGSYTNLAVTGLPTGLSAKLSGSTITVSGTPTQSGMFSHIAVSLQDSNGDKGSRTESLTINSAVTLGVLSPTQWDLNEPGYDGTIAVSGGSGTYSNLAVTGLPTGLSAKLSGSTITVSGTPTQIGTFTLTTTLQDSNGDKGSGTETLTVNPALSLGDLIGTDPLDPVDAAFDGTIDNTGDANGSAEPQALAASNASLSLGNLKPENAYVGELYEGTIAISGGTPSYKDLVVTGLPTWLYASWPNNPRTITITGTPPWTPSNAPGPAYTLSFQVTVGDRTSTKAQLTKTYQLPVESAVQDLLDHEGPANPNGNQLPNLQKGKLAAIGPPTPLYNCYAYAANQSNPQAIGWVWSGNPPPTPQPPDGAVIKTPVDNNPKYPKGLLSLFASYGWYPVVPKGSAQPHVPSTGLVVIYEDAAGSQHGALVTPSGVFAKMGKLGTYEFSRVDQMAGGGFGQPVWWLGKKSALPTVQLFPPKSGVYNGQPFKATATVAGFTGPAGSTLEGVGLTLQYYAGSSATGTPMADAPVNVGTYTVVASFAGSTDYINASKSATFTISRALPEVKVSASGGTFTGKPFSATATVAGVNGQYRASLEGVTPTLTYYAGSSPSGTALPGPPVNAGTYFVVASFAGSKDYTRAGSSATFTIIKVRPMVIIKDFDKTFTVYVVGVSGQYGLSLEGVRPTVTYYAGTAANGKPLPGAPSTRAPTPWWLRSRAARTTPKPAPQRLSRSPRKRNNILIYDVRAPSVVVTGSRALVPWLLGGVGMCTPP